MITIKHRYDHQIKNSPVCGKIVEIITSKDNPRIDIAMLGFDAEDEHLSDRI